jgi:hexokinase
MDSHVHELLHENIKIFVIPINVKRIIHSTENTTMTIHKT